MAAGKLRSIRGNLLCFRSRQQLYQRFQEKRKRNFIVIAPAAPLAGFAQGLRSPGELPSMPIKW